MSVAAKTREHSVSVTMVHKFVSGNLVNVCVREFRRDSVPPVQEKTRMAMRDKKTETSWDYIGQE